MSRVRLFTAVDVGASIRGHALSLQRKLATSGANVKWVEPDQMHITLNFLGEMDDREMYAISRVLTKVANIEPPFQLRAAGFGAFPNSRRPKTIWAALTDGLENLIRIYGRSVEPLTDLGVYRKEDRGYNPHLTLGRVKEEADSDLIAAELPKFADWHGGDCAIEELLLMRSELRREGPEYTVVARAPLQG
jgi:RNA 2',3'-cyclic 3'-phosphodiesterase